MLYQYSEKKDHQINSTTMDLPSARSPSQGAVGQCYKPSGRLQKSNCPIMKQVCYSYIPAILDVQHPWSGQVDFLSQRLDPGDWSLIPRSVKLQMWTSWPPDSTTTQTNSQPKLRILQSLQQMLLFSLNSKGRQASHLKKRQKKKHLSLKYHFISQLGYNIGRDTS